MRQPRRSLMDFSVPTAAAAERPAPLRSTSAASTRPLREPEPAASKAPRKPRERDMVATAAAQPKERREAGATKRAAIGHNQPPVALEDVASAAFDMLSQYRNLFFAQMQSAVTASLGFANGLSASASGETGGDAGEGASAAPPATAPHTSAIPADAIAPREFLRDGARRFWENELK